jgi:predicted RNA binding protein YcfA (HicA-like mRNA interferase family)
MKISEIIEMLEADGWMMTRFEIIKGITKRRFRHKEKPGSIYITGTEDQELPIRAVNSIKKRANLKQ